MAASNPYKPPLIPVKALLGTRAGYAVVSARLGWLGFPKRDAILKLLQECGDRGERLLASCTESSDRFHFVFKVHEISQVDVSKYSYMLVEAPRAKSLSKTTSGTLTDFMSAKSGGGLGTLRVHL